MKKGILPLIGLFLLLSAVVSPAFAQESAELKIRLNRDFGMDTGTGKIQGQFSVTASGPENLTRVTFYLDGQVLGEALGDPFRVRFSTDSYPPGLHAITAVGVTSSGEELRSNEIRANFVTAEDAMSGVAKILVPIGVIAIGAILLSALVPLLSGRKEGNVPLGAPRKYGPAGGAICKRCQRPFSRHFLAPNLVLGKLERCPHCGHWAIVAAAPPAMLRLAEEAELGMAEESGSLPQQTEEERLRKELENSKYQEM